MKRTQNLFVFLLLAIFAICAIFMTALSARVYRETVDASGENQESRILAQIVRGMAQSEDAGNASVKDEDGIQVLTFEHDYDGEIYVHRLFCADGWLRESFTSAEWEFETDMGEALVEAGGFEAEISGNLLTAEMTLPDGGTETVNVCLRAGGAEE